MTLLKPPPGHSPQANRSSAARSSVAVWPLQFDRIMHFSQDNEAKPEKHPPTEATHGDEAEQKSARARGTAAMDPETRQEVARKGGLAVSRNKQHMAEIGRKGGQSVSKNREHMARIGRKGGEASRRARSATDAPLRTDTAPSISGATAMGPGPETEKSGLTKKP